MTDRTEQPTARRVRRARAEGDSGASPYAAQAVAFVVAVVVAPAALRALAARTSSDLQAVIDCASRPALPVAVAVSSSAVVLEVLQLGLPVLVAAGVAGVAATLVQTGGVVSASRLAPRLDRLDPAAGMARLVSGARVFAALRALVAAGAFGALAWVELSGHRVDLARLASPSGRVGWVAAVISGATGRLAWRAALLGLALGALDLVVARRAWTARLKMTKAEVRRDYKDAEGDPATKAARERAHREVLAQATLASVRGASVVVVNPTHLACALRYDAGKGGDEGGDEAPVVVASGEGDFAARIVQAALAWGVPVVRDVPLARALLDLEVGDAIPEVLYEAVAAILRELAADDVPA